MDRAREGGRRGRRTAVDVAHRSTSRASSFSGRGLDVGRIKVARVQGIADIKSIRNLSEGLIKPLELLY